MRKLAVMLALATCAFAISTLHYARLLRELGNSASPEVPQSAVQEGAAVIEAASEPVAMDVTSQAAGDMGALVTEAASQSKYSARSQLEALRNPAERARRLKNVSALLRESWRTMADDLGLSEADVERVAAQLAELALQGGERGFACQVDPGCDFEALRKGPDMSQESRIAKVLTPDQYARYQSIREAWQENNIAFAFNLQLAPADAMDRATRDRLVQALVAVRRQVESGAAARGETLQGVEAATAYAQREIAAAAGVLTPAQLAIFRQRAEGRLFSYLEDLHEQQIAAAAREAAGLH